MTAAGGIQYRPAGPLRGLAVERVHAVLGVHVSLVVSQHQEVVTFVQEAVGEPGGLVQVVGAEVARADHFQYPTQLRIAAGDLARIIPVGTALAHLGHVVIR